MDVTTAWLLLVLLTVVFLVCLSAFFSGSETALTAASRARMHRLAEEGDRRAKLVNKLLSRRERLLGVILLGNNLANILASSLAAGVFIAVWGGAGVVYATLLMTAVIVMFAEVIPKTWAISRADATALRMAVPLKWMVRLLSPFAVGIVFAATGVLRLLGGRVSGDILSAHDELRGAIDLHHREGKVVKDDRDMIGGVLDLRELEVGEVMVHRKNMVMLDAGLSNGRIVAAVLESPHTRIPLWRGEPENVIGVVHVRDLARALAACGGDADRVDIEALAGEPWFVPETTGLPDQLKAFLQRKTHFAFVVDEYGVLMGMVTLEDILEEIVGEISDEHDRDLRGIRPLPDGSVTVDGEVTIRDLNRSQNWRLPDDEATTVAGLVIHEARAIPEAGQVYTFHNYRFNILRRKRNQIISLRVTPPPGA